MKPILVLRHIACEGPGYLEQVFKRHNIPLQMIHIDENQSVPDSLQDFAALVLVGGMPKCAKCKFTLCLLLCKKSQAVNEHH